MRGRLLAFVIATAVALADIMVTLELIDADTLKRWVGSGEVAWTLVVCVSGALGLATYALVLALHRGATVRRR